MADGSAYSQAINNAVVSAKSMLGKNEVPDNRELQDYLRTGGENLDPHKVAWCAAFVSASLQKAGLPVPTQVVKDSAFGPGAYAPNYQSYGSPVEPKNIQAGDILVNNNGSHVGFAEGPIRQGPNGPEVQLLAGNERDASGQYAPGSYTNPATGAVANRSQVGQVGERWVPLSQYSARRYQPPDGSDAPPVSGTTTLNSTPVAPQGSSILDTMRQNIGQYESGNNYNILGKHTNTGDYAIGKYQVMASHVPDWTQKWLGQSMTPEQFRADSKAQDAVFNGEFGSYLANHSPADASSMWFTGQPLTQGANKRDILGTSGAQYVAATIKGIDNPYAMNASSQPTPPHTPTPATAGAPYAPPQNAGDWLKKLITKPVTKDAQGNEVKGKSPLESLAGNVPTSQQNQPTVAALPVAQPVMDPMGQLAGPASQLFSTVSAAAAKPLSWSSAPYGSNAGQQMARGMTLNQSGYYG